MATDFVLEEFFPVEVLKALTLCLGLVPKADLKKVSPFPCPFVPFPAP